MAVCINIITWNVSAFSLVTVYQYFGGKKPTVPNFTVQNLQSGGSMSVSNIGRIIAFLCSWDRLNPICTAVITGPSAPTPAAIWNRMERWC